MAQVTIKLKNISIIRGEKQVFSNLNWTANKKEHWFIMGNNGSGKTTLIEIIMGYLWPQKGTVEILENTYGKTYIPKIREKIGYLSSWLFKRIKPNVLVKDVIASGKDASIGVCRCVDKSLQIKVKEQMLFFGISEYENTPFGNLSSGEQLKVLFARTIVSSIDILILDEPFCQLDIGQRMKMYRFLKKLSKKTNCPQFILVTHHIEDVIDVFTHGLFLKDGKIAMHGRKQDILKEENINKIFKIKDSH
ncbi:MAG: ATP-binding cassette domain-containing protein [Candidatus Omnitrophica bacterium]|nr:ATP-binding cassette domain-containing protein [Candidatus Omnitrophota bacterium]